MKGLLIIAISFLCLSSAGFAQIKTSTAVQPKPVVKKEAVKTEVKQNVSTQKNQGNGTSSILTTTSTNSKTKTKKDGTPDKRFKENKTTTSTVSTGPKKKDGTLDMRYKANKKKG